VDIPEYGHVNEAPAIEPHLSAPYLSVCIDYEELNPFSKIGL